MRERLPRSATMLEKPPTRARLLGSRSGVPRRTKGFQARRARTPRRWPPGWSRFARAALERLDEPRHRPNHGPGDQIAKDRGNGQQQIRRQRLGLARPPRQQVDPHPLRRQKADSGPRQAEQEPAGVHVGATDRHRSHNTEPTEGLNVMRVTFGYWYALVRRCHQSPQPASPRGVVRPPVRGTSQIASNRARRRRIGARRKEAAR